MKKIYRKVLTIWVQGKRYCILSQNQNNSAQALAIALGQWFLKYDPWTSSISVPCKPVRDANSWISSRPTESETLGVGSRRPCLNQPCVWTRGFWWRPKLENCCWEHVALVWLSMSFLIEAKILAQKNTYCMTPLYEIQKQEKWIYAIEIRERLPWGEAL